MITQYSLTDSAWTAITTVNQSGYCWLDEQDDGASGSMDVRVIDSTTGTPSDDDFTKAKRVYRPTGNKDMLPLSSDSSTDIFYARCKSGTAIISVSVA